MMMRYAITLTVLSLPLHSAFAEDKWQTVTGIESLIFVQLNDKDERIAALDTKGNFYVIPDVANTAHKFAQSTETKDAQNCCENAKKKGLTVCAEFIGVNADRPKITITVLPDGSVTYDGFEPSSDLRKFMAVVAAEWTK